MTTRILLWLGALACLFDTGRAFAGTGGPIVLTCSSNLTITASTPNGTNVYFSTSAYGGCSSPLNLSSSPPSGSTFAIGTTTVDTTASDACGDSTNCSFTVTVNRQAEPPIVLTCSSNLTITASTPNGTNVYFTTSAYGGCSSPLNLSSSPPSGSTFPIGTTTVDTTASDACGDSTNCSFTVTVNRQAEPPIVLTCSSNLTITASTPNGTNVYFTTSAYGGCSSPLNLSSSPPSGSTFPIGTTTVDTTASDACGDSTNCSFTVTVNRQAEPPIVLTCSSNLTVTASTPNGTNVYFTTSAYGGCSSPLNLSSSPPSGSTFPIGTTTVDTTASDACGDSTNCSFTVTVNRQAEPPIVLTCSSNLTITASTPDGTNVYFTTSAYGGCSSPLNLLSSPPSGSTFPIGTTTVDTTASDACGDSTNCSFTVTVNRQAEPPIVLTCSSNLTITASTPNGTNVYFTTSAYGGCSSPLNLSSSPPSGSTFPIGTTTVDTTASDACGDSTNCSFTVTVNPFRPVLRITSAAFYPFFEVGWTEESTGAGSQTNQPVFGLEMAGSLQAGAWTVYDQGFVRRINNDLLAKVQSADVAYYRLNNTVTNPLFIPSAATLAATLVTAGGATLNGSTTPILDHTLDYFEYGADTNYGLFTPTNQLTTSTNPASLGSPISGLAASSLYHFQLVVMDPDGTQYGGDEFFTTLAASQPTPPAVITLTASSLTTTSAVLNGTINGVTSYAVAHFQYGNDTNYTGGQAGTYFTSSTGQTEPFNYPLTGLSPNTTYHYRAFGFNCCTEGFGGDITFTTATPQPPPTVTTLAAGAINTNSAQLNGAVNPNGAGTTAFFQWGADTTYGNVTTQTGIGTTPQSDFQATLTGLSSSTTYHYRMVANNSSTISYGADASFITAWAPLPPTLVSPGTPTDTGSTVGTLTPTLTWNGFSQATEYNLMVSAYPSGAVVYSSVPAGTSVQMPGGYLQAGTKYDWSVNSVNSVGEAGANSTPLVFQTASLPSVQTLSPTNGVGDGSVTLLGTVNPNGSGTTVYFEYGPTTSYGTITTQTGIGTTAQTFSALVTGLLRDRTYHYRMDAVNGIGPSQGSDVSFVTP